MAILNPVNRRNNTNLTNVKGVDFDLEKMKKALSSKFIDMPANQTVEERSLWLQKMMKEKRLATAQN